MTRLARFTNVWQTSNLHYKRMRLISSGGKRMKFNHFSSPVSAEIPGFTIKWAEIGDFVGAYEACAAGVNHEKEFTVTPDNACPVEHLIYVISGTARVEYLDGEPEMLEAGDLAWVRKGHRPYVMTDFEMIEFSRKSEHNGMIADLVEAGLFPSDSGPRPAG